MKFLSIDCMLGSELKTANDLSDHIVISTLKKIEEKSGIINRRVCSELESAASLAKKLLNNIESQKHLNDADLLIVVSESKRSPIPPMSSHILSEFGLKEGLIVLDLDSGCAGYVQALQVVDAFFRNPLIKKALIITTDAYSKLIKSDDRSVAPIFGDGSSFTVLVNDGSNSIKAFHNGTDATKADNLMTNESSNRSLHMEGAEIFMFVKKYIPPSIRHCLKFSSEEVESIDYFFLHQASLLVMKELREDLCISESKSPFLIANTGNLVSTSIPFVLSQYLDKLNNKTIVLSGFGVGLTWSTIVMELK